MSNPEIDTVTEWVKVPTNAHLTFVGRDAICVGSGCHLLFYSLVYGQQHVYSACKQEHKGDGVQCYAGHRQLSIFAFAEKCLDPQIMILTYPEFNLLKVLQDGAPEGYMALTFSDHEYLISLSNIPDFEIIIWNWRTQEKLASTLTHMQNPNQILSCSIHSPVSVIQYYEGANKFLMWDIHSSYKRCALIQNKIEMPDADIVINITWNTEGALFVLNNNGCIYMLNSENKLDLIIHGPGIGCERPCFTWFKGGLLVAEPNLDIKHFKRTGKWVEDWSVCPNKILQLIASSSKDYLIGWSDHGEILELDVNKYSFLVRKQYESNFHDICLVSTTYNYFVTLSNEDELKVWETLTGNQVGCINIGEKVNVIASNPEYPYIAAGLSSGTLQLVSVFNPEEPIILTKFYLYHEEITKVAFNDAGNIIVAANLKFGLFFIIQGIPGKQFKIVAYIDYRRQSVDICITEDEKSYKLYILVQTDKCNSTEQRIVLKTISKQNEKIKKKIYLSQKQIYTHFSLSDGVFYAKPYRTKTICALQFLKKNVRPTNEILTGHFMRNIVLENNNHHVYTYGFDGMIILRSKDLKESLTILMPHHRMDEGVRRVIVDPMLRYVISLGNDNVLVCSKIVKTKIDDRKIKENAKKLFNLGPIFSAQTIGFEPTGEDEGKTFLEMREQKVLQQEKEQYAKERQNIMEEFGVLQQEVVRLLDANLNGPELEKIDIREFYLHVKLKEHKEKMTEKECEWTVMYYKDLIRAQDELWLSMKEKFWDTMLVKRSVIKGIFSNFSVENYTIVPNDMKISSHYEYFTTIREFEEMLRTGDLFNPWVPTSDSVIAMHLNRPPVIAIKDEGTRIMEVLEEAEVESDTENVTSIMENYPSTTICEFIEPSKYLYKQEEIHTYAQMNSQRYIIVGDAIETRKFFNVKYEEMMQQKHREMNTMIEKNNRLRYILSELKNDKIDIEDPIWFPSEVPESIIVVKKSEIGITPYISPSEQAILDWEAAEAERIRLLLLADDFREKALIKMMDGVLEVRWEDTLKRDIPKPKCLLEKEPANYNEEDLRAIRDYEEKVAFLNSERQRYRNMLEQEYSKVAESIREGVKKFNARLRELLLFKIRVESARSQQVLAIQRMQMMCKTRIFMMEKEESIKEDIRKNEEQIISVQQKISQLLDASTECKTANEILLSKEKQLEKNFKKDFQDYSALIQEQATKLYKKHPKVQIRGVNSVSLLIELGNCCVTQERSLILTQECLEYLRSIDNLDQYVGVPNTIDEAMYKIICRHRRLRLDNEIRVKANAIEQSEIEIAIQTYQKYLGNKKDNGVKLVADLAQLRHEKLLYIHNKELQIVVKQGLVELPTRGFMSDYKDAIMINRKDVENINAIILKVGQMKLRVMTDKMIHRRAILMKEWEHKRMKMEIEDLKEYLYMIRKVKVTKEIQLYLRKRAKGLTADQGTLTLDQEIEITKKSYEKMIAEKQNAVKELESQIKDYKKKNAKLDEQIAEINVDVCEQHVNRNLDFEEKTKESNRKRMAAIVKRSKLVKQIQEQHNEILVLQTELELLRLKTYPTLKFKTLL